MKFRTILLTVFTFVLFSGNILSQNVITDLNTKQTANTSLIAKGKFSLLANNPLFTNSFAFDELLSPQTNNRSGILWMRDVGDNVFENSSGSHNNPTNNFFAQNLSVNQECTTDYVSVLGVQFSEYGQSGLSLYVKTNQPSCVPTDITLTGGGDWFHIDHIQACPLTGQYCAKLFYTTDPNLTGAERQFILSHPRGSSYATQRGDCVVLITNTSDVDTFSSAGGVGSITYQTSPNCPSTVLEVEGGFITLESNTTFRVQPRTQNDPQFRNGVIKAGSFRQTIKQGDTTTNPTPKKRFLIRTKTVGGGVRG